MARFRYQHAASTAKMNQIPKHTFDGVFADRMNSG